MAKSKRLIAGVGGLTVVAASAGILAFGAGAANAATSPYNDASSVGTISFYDSNGNVITTGPTNSAPFAAYAVGSVLPHSGDTQGEIVFANPDPGSKPVSWYTEAAGNYNPFPVTTGPANIKAMTADHPVVAGGAKDDKLDGFENDSVISTTAGYANMVQVRLVTADSANQPATTYDEADISIDPTAHTWTQVYPTPATATTTVLTSSENPSTSGDSVVLTATESVTAASGSVQFMDGSAALGSPVAVSGGVAKFTTSALAVGSHSLSAVFTPTDPSSFAGSTGTLTQVVNPAATKTTTVLAVTQDSTAGDDAKLSATVTDPSSTGVTAGSVSFYDGTSTTPLGTVQGTNATSGGVYTLDLPTGFASGQHSIVAKFTPTSVTTYTVSQSAATPFTTSPKQGVSVTSDAQGIQATVPAGTIVISTPYTAASPLDLGTMSLNTAGTEFTASGHFADIKVTDMRSGATGYTVSALSDALSDGSGHANGTISGEDVGLTNLAFVPAAGYSGTTTATANPAAEPAVAPTDTGAKGLGGATPHTVFSESGNTTGTIDANGLLTINAPTSTEAGTYTGTITFTVG
jgi:hypothetical protein